MWYFGYPNQGFIANIRINVVVISGSTWYLRNPGQCSTSDTWINVVLLIPWSRWYLWYPDQCGYDTVINVVFLISGSKWYFRYLDQCGTFNTPIKVVPQILRSMWLWYQDQCGCFDIWINVVLAIPKPMWYFQYSNKCDSCTPRTLRACCSQSKFRILKIRESSARALFLYNCTPNISRSADASVSVA